MGLDNSIEVRRTPETNKIEELKVFNKDWDKELRWDFEICYWRKCWGLRGDILDILGKGWDDEYKFTLTKEHVESIIELLGSYDAETWINSIWAWDGEWAYSEYVKQNIKDLKFLR